MDNNEKNIFSRQDFSFWCFTAGMAILFFVFMTLLVINPNGAQLNIFSVRLNDFFADFFYLVHDSSERDNYSQYRGSYFPLAYLILYPFSKLDNFSAMTLEQMWMSKMGLMAVFLFTLFSMAVFFLSLNQLRKKYKLPLYVLIGLLLSGVWFFSMERGNLIFLSAAGVCLYLCYYDSGNKKERMFAVFALALAATLKVYPAIYGLLYLEKKQYKEIFLCIISTLLLVFLPFVFFKGGFSNIQLLIDNMKGITAAYYPNTTFVYWVKNSVLPFSARFSLQHMVYLLSNGIFDTFDKSDTTLFSHLLARISSVFLGLITLLSVIYSLVLKNKLLKLSLLTLVLLFFPVPSYLYCGLYIFPVIIMYFSTHNNYPLKYNIFFIVFFIVVLNPVQIGWMFNDDTGNQVLMSINYILVNAALLILWQILLINASRQLVRENNEIKNIDPVFKKLRMFLLILFFVIFFVVLLFSIPKIYFLLINFVENFVLQRKLSAGWDFLGQNLLPITIIGIAMMIEIVINIFFLKNKNPLEMINLVKETKDR
jgi:hypothetical protein